MCQYCGYRGKELTVDHVIPKSFGGKSVWENVVAACRKCNLKKGSKALNDTGMFLMKKPGKPRFLVFPNMPDNPPKSHLESWTKYL